MTRKLIIGIVTAIAAVPAIAATALTGTNTACNPTGNITTSRPSHTTATASTGQWNAEQVANAQIIVQVGRDRQIPPRGWVIAVATAMQESSLRNLAGGDRDSIGLFQQRPSQGWGTPQQLVDPAYQAGKFYTELLTIHGWQTTPLTEAAQAVQRSAYPDAYAKWEGDATSLVQQQATATSSSESGCLSMPFSTTASAPRNADGSWPREDCSIRPDPTTGTGCVTPRLLHLVRQASAAGFPKPNCFRVDDHGEHPKGRACDWMTSGGEATGPEKARGDAMAAWAVINADRLAVRYVIWYRMIWTRSEGWHPYNNPWGGNDPSGWHTNHIHISVE
jgi:hypothetical protein